jgi:urease accessory protein
MHPNEASTPELSVSDSTDTLVSLRVGQPELGASLELEPSSPTRDWLLWQLADSAFPTGGFAHSSGLEAAYQQGEVRGRDELRAFLETSLRQQFHFALPFVVGAHRKPEELRELDAWFDTLLTNHVGNRASRAQGRSWRAVVRKVFKLGDPQPPCGHFGPIYGALCRELGVSETSTCHLFLFLQLRSLLSSAVRLNIVGPLEAQALQHELSSFARQVLECPVPEMVDAVQTAPLLEIWQGAHDRLYARLFQS